MQMDYDTLTAGEMFGEFLGAVSGAVLAPGASEGDLQMTETTVHEALDVSIYQREHMPQECQDLPVGLQELLNLTVKAGHGTETFVLARIVDGTAVEDITSSITGQILGNAFFIGKTMDMDFLIKNLRKPKPAVDVIEEITGLGFKYNEDYITGISKFLDLEND